MPLQHWVRVRPWHCLCISEFTVWVQMLRAKTGGLWFKCLRLEVCLDSIGHRCPLELPCWGQHCSWAPRKRSHGQQQNICNYVDWKMPRQHRHTGLPLCSISSGSKSLLQVWTKLTFYQTIYTRLHLQCQLPENLQQSGAFRLYEKPPHLQTS